MNPHATRAAEIEAAFLAGAESNLNQAREQRLRGSRWVWTTRTQEDRLRELMAANQQHDRDLLRAMPKNTARLLTASQTRWFVGRRTTAVAIATSLAPLEHLLTREDEPPPIGLAELVTHVKGLVGEATVPHLVGVCSPTGFTEDARSSGLELPNVTLVLVEPRADAGWKVTTVGPNARPGDGRLFDPEAVTAKIERVREEIRSRSADLLTGGLSARAIGERLGLPTSLVGRVFEGSISTDPELRVSRQGGDVLLYRGAAAEMEDDEMSMVDWIKQLFSGQGDEARKINALSERRARLVQRRDRLYDDITKLEQREGDLLKQGREAASATTKRRVATQIKQVRDDMERLGATARMLGQQVDVISTHIHNLTLIQQGQLAKLPSSEEITEDAVRAEEMLEQLNAEVDLAGSLSSGITGSAVSDEELDILKELEGGPTAESTTETASEPKRHSAAADTARPSEEREPPHREQEAG